MMVSFDLLCFYITLRLLISPSTDRSKNSFFESFSRGVSAMSLLSKEYEIIQPELEVTQ